MYNIHVLKVLRFTKIKIRNYKDELTLFVSVISHHKKIHKYVNFQHYEYSMHIRVT